MYFQVSDSVAMAKYILGIDIGGTNTKFGVVNESGSMLIQHRISTPSFSSVTLMAATIYEQLSTDGLLHKIGQIGIGAPNANHLNGNIEYAQNLQWQGVVPLATVFEKKFSLPVRVTNDANAAALAELHFGAAKNLKNFIAVTLGTGLGSGIICNGQPVYGHTGVAAELGHLIIEPEGRICPCGRKGCLERYASATGLMITANEQATHYDQPTQKAAISTHRYTDAEAVAEAAQNGDPVALETFDRTARWLALGLANAVSLLGPEAFFISGGLAQAGNLLFEPTQRYLQEALFPVLRNTVQILPSALNAQGAGIMGAVALCTVDED